MLIALSVTGWLVVAAAAVRLFAMYREESRPDRILGLLYHRVVPRYVWDRFRGTERIFSTPVERFTEQLEWLRDHGHHFVTLDQLTEHLAEGAPLPKKPVCVTFDDGCASVHDLALPVLKSLGIPAGVFVTTDADAWIFHEGEYFERRMEPGELRACADGGIAIGSHAISHRGLNEMSREAALHELVESRRVLSEWCGREVRHFAIPLNFYDEETLRLCREAGYASVSTSDNGTSNADTSPFRIKRFIVEGSYDLVAFSRSLEPRVILQRRVLNALKKLPPRLLGEKLWMPLRERVFESPIGRWLSFQRLRVGLLVVGAAGLAALTLLTAAVLLPWLAA